MKSISGIPLQLFVLGCRIFIWFTKDSGHAGALGAGSELCVKNYVL